MAHQILITGAESVWRWCRERPDAIAIIENDVSYIYATLARNIAQAAKALASAGTGPGSIVGIECDARYLYLILALASETLGAAHVAIAPSELGLDRDPARRCDVLCVRTEDAVTLAGKPVVRLTRRFVHEMVRQPVDEADLERLGHAFPEGDIVRIGRTSGTSGEFKFVAHARGSLRNLLEIIPYLTKFDEARLNFISLYSFNNIGTYTRCLSALREGATVVFSAGDELAANGRKLPGCHTFLLVRDAAALVASEQFRDGGLDACSLRVHGGFLPPALRAALRERMTADVVSLYSMNETSVVMTSDGQEPGTLLPGVSVRIVDDHGQDVKPGDPGRIVVRTPWMSAGYPWDTEQTKAHFVDGWFLTSDLGAMPEPGRLLVLGRTDEMINLGGIKFAPHPIETRIRTMPGVTDAVLIDLENAAGTGDLHIFVERNDPAIDRATAALIAPLLAGIAESSRIHYVSELPRTNTGKVQRGRLMPPVAR